MNFELTSEQYAMREAVRRMVEHELRPIALRHDERILLPKVSCATF